MIQAILAATVILLAVKVVAVCLHQIVNQTLILIHLVLAAAVVPAIAVVVVVALVVIILLYSTNSIDISDLFHFVKQ